MGAQIADGTWHAGPGSVKNFKAGNLQVPYDLDSYNPSLNSQVIYMNLNVKTAQYVKWSDPIVPGSTIMSARIDGGNVGCEPPREHKKAIAAICSENLASEYKQVMRKAQKRPVLPSFFESASKASVRVRVAPSGEKFRSYIPWKARLGNKWNAYFMADSVNGQAVAKIVGRISFETYDGRSLSTVKTGTYDPKAKKCLIQLVTEDFVNVKRSDLAAASFYDVQFSAYDALGNLLIYENKKVQIRQPGLTVNCGKKVNNGKNVFVVGEMIKCDIGFSNPMPFPLLTMLSIHLTGNDDAGFAANNPGVAQSITIPPKRSVFKSPEEFRGWFRGVHVKATTPGQHSVIVVLKNGVLNTVTGSTVVKVAGSLPLGLMETNAEIATVTTTDQGTYAEMEEVEAHDSAVDIRANDRKRERLGRR